MLKTFSFTMMILFVLIYQASSPFLISIFLIGLSTSVGGLCWILTSKWLSLALLFIFIGGMMIVFLYVSAISANSKLIFYNPYSFLSILLLLFIFPLTFNSLALSTPIFLYKFYNFYLFSFLIVYLLSTLFISTKISESFKGALIQKF